MKRFALTITVPTALCTLLLIAAPADATFPGTNGRIAFALDRGNGGEIYTMRPDGTDVRRLTHLGPNAERPQWSPDGTRIVFQMDRPDTDCGFIELMNRGGSNLVDITPARYLSHGCVWGPSFTPNGNRVVFAAQRCGRCVQGLRSVRLDGTGFRRIIDARRLFKYAPKVSPDGRTVAFVGSREDTNALFTVRMNGTHLHRVVPFSVDVGGFSWAPNGRRIVFSDHANTPTKPGNLDTVRPDGTGFRQLTHFEGVDLRAGCSCSFSPDGRWIVYRRFNESTGRYGVWKMHPDGTHQVRILGTKHPATGNDWGPRPT
jgi:Tol biopolymer transport system component